MVGDEKKSKRGEPVRRGLPSWLGKGGVIIFGGKRPPVQAVAQDADESRNSSAEPSDARVVAESSTLNPAADVKKDVDGGESDDVTGPRINS